MIGHGASLNTSHVRRHLGARTRYSSSLLMREVIYGGAKELLEVQVGNMGNAVLGMLNR